MLPCREPGLLQSHQLDQAPDNAGRNCYQAGESLLVGHADPKLFILEMLKTECDNFVSMTAVCLVFNLSS